MLRSQFHHGHTYIWSCLNSQSWSGSQSEDDTKSGGVSGTVT
uniref:Uncharacterized protein n=1 Tax=Anguilla anguilla TaxID=7936 RepID=A0A0E9PTZ6_ANGAN